MVALLGMGTGRIKPVPIRESFYANLRSGNSEIGNAPYRFQFSFLHELLSLHFPARGNRKRQQRIIEPRIYRHSSFPAIFCGRFRTYHRFLSHLRCSAILTRLIARAVMNMSPSNIRHLIHRFQCWDLDPRTKAKFCGLVVEAFVERYFDGFATDDGSTRVAQLG
jgi:hypothetical protein